MQVTSKRGIWGAGELALIGFVFSSRPGWFIFVILCGKEGCIGFVFARIGFVLRNKEADLSRILDACRAPAGGGKKQSR